MIAIETHLSCRSKCCDYPAIQLVDRSQFHSKLYKAWKFHCLVCGKSAEGDSVTEASNVWLKHFGTNQIPAM